MYRLIPVILYAVSTAAAPQYGASAPNSDITYVKIQPVTESVLKKQAFRASRIENIPLTIPGTINVDNRSEEVAIVTEDSTQVKDKSNENDEIDIDNTQDNPRKARSDDSTTSYEESEPTEIATEAEDVTKYTEDYESRTKAPSPRFLSKLSYFQKDVVKSSIATNLVERPGKRRFKSKCRCEKIWNCPKLQITVPRCPNEYFMCCF